MLAHGTDAKIQFFCVEPDHAVPDGPDQLTIHQGKWAFCPRGRIGETHRWDPTGGLGLGELITFARGRTAATAAQKVTQPDHPRRMTPASE